MWRCTTPNPSDPPRRRARRAATAPGTCAIADRRERRRVLRFAATTADRVGITGLGRTLGDGHHHEVEWTTSRLDRTVDLVTRTAEAAGRSPEIDVLVQHVQITEDAERAAAELVEHIPGASVDDLLRAPYVWIGTVAEIADRLHTHHNDRGLNRYTIRDHELRDVQRILDTAAAA